MSILNEHSTQIIGSIHDFQSLGSPDSSEMHFQITIKVFRPYRDTKSQVVYDFIDCLLTAGQFFSLKNDSLTGETVIISGQLVSFTHAHDDEQLFLKANSVVLKRSLDQHGSLPHVALVADTPMLLPTTC